MKGSIFLFVGIILVSTGILTFYMIGRESTTVEINGQRTNSPEVRAILQYSIGGFLGALGLLFVVAGLRGKAKARKHQKEIMHIMETGVAVEGTVTFLDRNYRMLINNTPIYFILEYTYSDYSGKQHVRRVETVPSEYVIRNKIEVGSTVAIKYAAEDSSKSTILL